MQGMQTLHGDIETGIGRIPILNGDDDWLPWFAFTRAAAMAGGVWDYINPDPKPSDEPVLAPMDEFDQICLRLQKIKDDIRHEREHQNEH